MEMKKPDRDLERASSGSVARVKRLGLDKNAASKELHAIKEAGGMRGADNVWINYGNGTVRSQQTCEIIGNLIP
jgi:hypothetical protein